MVDGKPIKLSPCLKLLGVTRDDNLIYNVHKKTSKKIGVLARLRNILPMQAKLQLYKSALLPNLTYCHIVWHFCYASDARKLERIQERALRVVFAYRTATYVCYLKCMEYLIHFKINYNVGTETVVMFCKLPYVYSKERPLPPSPTTRHLTKSRIRQQQRNVSVALNLAGGGERGVYGKVVQEYPVCLLLL